MGRCELCGNEYDKAFAVVVGGESPTFDSCARCASAAGVAEVADRA